MRHLIAFVGAAALAAPVFAQPGPDAAASLQRAVVIEQQEGDLRTAEAEYRRLADATGDAEVAAAAALRLGELLLRLERGAEARPFLLRARDHGGAIGEQALLVLQGQDPAGKQAQELATRAARAIDELTARDRQQRSELQAELRWLGAAVVPELGKRLAAVRAAVLQQLQSLPPEQDAATSLRRMVFGGAPPQEVSTAYVCHHLLLHTGGKEAAALLDAQLRDPAPEWRRLLALATAPEVPGSALPIVAQLLRDTDPTGATIELALSAGKQLPFDDWLALLQSQHANVRVKAWEGLPSHAILHGSTYEVTAAGEAAIVRVLPLCDQVLQTDGSASREAFRFLRAMAGASGSAAELFLRWLPRVPVYETDGAPNAGVQQRVRAPLVRLHACAEALGPATESDDRNDRRRTVVGNALHAARPGDAALLLDLAEWGYDRLAALRLVADALTLQPSADELVRAAGLLGRCAGSTEAAEKLGTIALPVAASAPLRRRCDALLASYRPPTDAMAAWTQTDREIHGELMAVLRAIGQTGDPAVLDWLWQLQARESSLRHRALATMLAIAERSADAASLATLRTLLHDETLDARQRNEVFGVLVKAGDEAAIPLYAKAYELGLEAVGVERVEDGGTVHVDLRGIGWTSEPGHRRYTEGQRLAIWQSLLGSSRWLEALQDIGPEASLSVHTAALRSIAARMPELVPALGVDRSEGSSLPDWLLRYLGSCGSRVPLEDAPGAADYREAIGALFADAECGVYIAAEMRDPRIRRLFAQPLTRLLQTPWALEAFQMLASADVSVATADILVGLQHTRPKSIPFYLAALPREAPAELIAAVEALAQDQDANVRIAVCSTLGRMLSANSAPTLLSLLRDVHPEVREAATAALQQIRLYHEQKAFWDQFQTGISTSQQAAAAKLLAQGKPDQPKARRLLALQSLGVLGAPEALPYLIDWTADADAEIAAAARAAIVRLQASTK